MIFEENKACSDSLQDDGHATHIPNELESQDETKVNDHDDHN